MNNNVNNPNRTSNPSNSNPSNKNAPGQGQSSQGKDQAGGTDASKAGRTGEGARTGDTSKQASSNTAK